VIDDGDRHTFRIGVAAGQNRFSRSLNSVIAAADTVLRVIYFFRRGDDRLACETRLNPLGVGYELVVTTDDETRVEPFEELSALLSREHDLLQTWRAMGWRETSAAAASSAGASSEPWLGRR
jgi:hypothetical protein